MARPVSLSGESDERPEHHHAARFYTDDAAVMDEVARLLAVALQRGQSALVLATPDHREVLARGLTAAGIDVPAVITNRRYLAIDAAETLAACSVDGHLDLSIFERAVTATLAICAEPLAAGQPIAVFGELVGLLTSEGRFDEAIQVESFWNAQLAIRPITLVCAYPAHAFARAEAAAAYQDICNLHETVHADEPFPAVAGPRDQTRVARIDPNPDWRGDDATRLLEQAIDGIYLLDDEGIIRFANPALLDLLGYPATEMIGAPFARFQRDPWQFTEFWNAINRHDQAKEHPLELIRADGAIVSVLVRAAARWDGSHLAEVRCLVRDITAQRGLEQQLREQNDRLAAALEARDAFLLVAAHELKTPITSLRIFTQLLRREQTRTGAISPERLGQTLESIERQSAMLTRLVERLLDSTWIDAGRLRIEPIPADLAGLVRAMVNEQALAGSHHFELDAPAELITRYDPIRFAQVITNLLLNACRYSAPGTLVAVALTRADDGGIRLTVTDQGVGIPVEQREAIFTRYHQVHAESHLSGLGLGLAITKQIVTLHGGEIWVEQPPHRGSRFVVTLPPA